MDCSDVDGLIVPYLRGALDDDRAAMLEKHISACRGCSRAMAEEMVADLAQALPQKTPPQSVRDRLFHRVEAGSPLRRVVTSLGSWASGQAGRFRQRATRGLFGGAAVALVVALMATGVWFNDRLSEIARDAELLSDELAIARERESEVMSAVEEHREATYELIRMSSTPGTSVNTLLGTGPWSSARGIVMVSYSSNRGLLLVTDLPALPSDRIYRVWLMRNGVKYDAGWFTVDPLGYGQTIIIPLAPFGQFDGMGITIEPRGGSGGPTGVNVLEGDL